MAIGQFSFLLAKTTTGTFGRRFLTTDYSDDTDYFLFGNLFLDRVEALLSAHGDESGFLPGGDSVETLASVGGFCCRRT